MTIIGMYVFNVSLQNFTESKTVTHKSISYAGRAAYAAWADPKLKSYVNISLFKLTQLDIFLCCQSFYLAFYNLAWITHICVF